MQLEEARMLHGQLTETIRSERGSVTSLVARRAAVASGGGAVAEDTIGDRADWWTPFAFPEQWRELGSRRRRQFVRALWRELPRSRPSGGIKEAVPALVADARAAVGWPASASGRVAIGITPSDTNQHRLAIRLLDVTPATVGLAKYVVEEASGDAEVAVLGRLIPHGLFARPPERRRQRPLRGGISVGHAARRGGTLGCFVTDPETGQIGLMSAAHVLTSPAVDDRFAGTVVQPGSEDGGRAPADRIAGVARFVYPDPQSPANSLDAAVALLDEASAYDPGAPRRVVDDPLVLPERDPVVKIGRTTGRTSGLLTSGAVVGLAFAYPHGRCVFDGLAEVASPRGVFSRVGDSGSLVVREVDGAAVGVLVGGEALGGPFGTGRSFVMPINDVLDGLGLTLAD